MPPKKAKKKAGAKSKSIQPAVPAEWQEMPVDELRTLVADKETELELCRKSRNKAQVEHASVQEYYNVTKEQIRELDMRIDKIDLDIENAEEDNITELRVYKQKSKFIQYCHDNKIKATLEEDDLKQKNCNTNQEKRLSELESTKEVMMAKLYEIEVRQAQEIKGLQAEIDRELEDMKQNLDSETSRFQRECDDRYAQLKEDLESKRKAKLDVVASRKESHLQDLMQSHEKTYKEMKEYFEEIEKQQEIEMEELQMEIRRLKKAAVNHDETKERLETSNAENGKELDECLQQVTNLEIKTKDYTKNTISLQNTNARLALTKRRIREAKLKFAKLQDDYAKLQNERDMLRDRTAEASVFACKENARRKAVLEDRLMNQKQDNATIERHLYHIINSAGLNEQKAAMLLSNFEKFVEENAKEVERLVLAIARAKKNYGEALEAKKVELNKLGVSGEDILTLDVLADKQYVCSL